MGKGNAAKRRREARLAARIQEIRKEEYAAGVAAGEKSGEASTLRLVLAHAGRHYQNGSDADASAVREVYRAIVNAPAERRP